MIPHSVSASQGCLRKAEECEHAALQTTGAALHLRFSSALRP